MTININTKKFALWALLGITAYGAFNSLFYLIKTIGETVLMITFRNAMVELIYDIGFSLLYPLIFTLIILPLVKKARAPEIRFPTGWFITLLVCWPVLQLMHIAVSAVQTSVLTRNLGIEEISSVYQMRGYSSVITSFVPELTVIVYGIIFISTFKPKDNTSLDANVFNS